MTTVREVRLTPAEAAASVASWEAKRKRAAKRGLSGGYTVHVETRPVTEQHPVLGPITTEASYLTWEGTPLRYGGWRFVDLVEWVQTSEGYEPLPRVMPGYEGEPIDREWVAEPACDHCGTTRYRKHVVVVESETGERKRVGSTCVKDYLGWEFSPTWFAEPGGDLDEWGGGWGGESTAGTTETVAVAVRVVRVVGWRSRTKASDEGGVATADIVETLLWGPETRRREYLSRWPDLDGGLTGAEVAEAERLVAWGQTLGSSDYALNLAVALRAEWQTWRTTGLTCSVVGSWQRTQEREAAEAAKGLVEERYAPDKTRLKGLVLTVTAVRDWEGHYGVTHAHTFEGEGHRFQWLTGSARLEEGRTYVVTGTVKGVREWEGRVFTTLTRCAVTPASAAA